MLRLNLPVGITEQILIFIFFGNVDPDTKSIFHLMDSKNSITPV